MLNWKDLRLYESLQNHPSSQFSRLSGTVARRDFEYREIDRAAIGAVQEAIQNWGKLIIVYGPSEADVIILVTSRPSEDVMAVYDAHTVPSGNFLWRVMGRDGLQSGETPLVTQFENGFESVQKHK